MVDRLVDARGLKCPLPVMLAAKALRDMPAGASLRVLATDPGAPQDFADLCESRGHELSTSREAEGEFEFVIRAGRYSSGVGEPSTTGGVGARGSNSG